MHPDNSASVQLLSCDSSKPGRQRQDGVECWVALSTQSFADEMIAHMPLSVDGTYNPQTFEVGRCKLTLA